MLRCDLCTYAMLFVLLLLQFAIIRVHSDEPAEGDTKRTTVHPGRYRPELHGAVRGVYMPDDSGKYRHIKVPYSGGYGDRGLGYMHDARALPPTRAATSANGFDLGSKDHLRFSIDFNTNSKGWEIVQFDWVRDGDQAKQYKYAHQKQLFPMPEAVDVAVDNTDSAIDATTVAANVETVTGYSYGKTNVHVAGEYENKIYNVSYSNDNKQNPPSQIELQAAIQEVLEYIQNNILPTLN